MPSASTFDRGEDHEEPRPELGAPVDLRTATSSQRPDPPVERELAALGDHVGVVLGAAESAAETLLLDADREAQRMRQAALKQAEELREQAAADAEADRAEARRQLARAKEEARALRTEADAHAESRKAEAAAQARNILGDAKQLAAKIVEAAASRHRALQGDISAGESRVHEFALSLAEGAARLEEISRGAGATDADADLQAALRCLIEEGS